ncbi:hypothetical protein DPMN_005610 [Dreissena polymorpha]|uniref:Uncharacterized protein n=1 Tax=Dreissena polymorpha TaxID=45954 RepID=A0A9D4RWR7_DREPO|nr:hypothetical protein DPMN_005610 [Dreissena polymorpha]
MDSRFATCLFRPVTVCCALQADALRPVELLYGLTRFARSEDELCKSLFRKLSFQSENSISIMPPRKRRTKAPRATKDAQVEEQPECPCLPPHDQEEPTAPVDPSLTNEDKESEGGACARKRTNPRVITVFNKEEKELILDFI